ncbi:helix-turn-helix transcriptional regulator [Streptomyces sp. NPDC050504]|uniref:helix-turn-helix transcriptional regulator n=1 Tax=Streptomyces sp. NPDC050504 TaxID=3365618 RepID=UPI00379FE8F2
MKADRLVATLLFLQERGRVTVAEVAAELEVSVRTARRDLEALALAGVPVYSQRGRGGGWSLVGGARTNLTGLTADEIRSLFLLAGPSSTTPASRTALRKLVRALPAPLRDDAKAASEAGVVDGLDWSRTAVSADEPWLGAVQRAVVTGVRIRLGYARPGRPARERTVHPLGLASKAGAWYLVAGTDEANDDGTDGGAAAGTDEGAAGRGKGTAAEAGEGAAAGLRTYRLSRVTSVAATGEPVVRPEGFDLATAWRALAARMEERMAAVTVRAVADADAEPLLRRLFGGRLRIAPREPAAPDDRIRIELDGPSPEVVAAQLAGLGARVEVLHPPGARAALAETAAALTALYGPVPEPRKPA